MFKVVSLNLIKIVAFKLFQVSGNEETEITQAESYVNLQVSSMKEALGMILSNPLIAHFFFLNTGRPKSG